MSQPPINIVAAEPAGDYRLRLTFDDGVEQTVDFKPFLTRASNSHFDRFPSTYCDYETGTLNKLWVTVPK